MKPRAELVGLLLLVSVGAMAAETPVYYVRPLGDVDSAHTRYACRVMREVFHVRCHVMRARPLPRRAFDPERNQYDAGHLVEILFDDVPSDAIGLLAVTNADLFEVGRTRFVFGLASLVDHVGVVSLARYRGTWWGQDRDHVRFRDRFYKVLVHEAAHTLGLGHCESRRCTMRDDRTLEELDGSPRRFCRRCRDGVREGLRYKPGTARWHYTRGHSHLSRGEFPQAVLHFQRTVELEPHDARALNDLGVAYLRRGDVGRALWHFREAQRLDPTFARPSYNLGLIFLDVGDYAMARGAFERAVAAEPMWGPAHRQLGVLYQKHLDDPEQALTHYQAYLDTHGDDPAVSDQVRFIKGGGRSQP